MTYSDFLNIMVGVTGLQNGTIVHLFFTIIVVSILSLCFTDKIVEGVTTFFGLNTRSLFDIAISYMLTFTVAIAGGSLLFYAVGVVIMWFIFSATLSKFISLFFAGVVVFTIYRLVNITRKNQFVDTLARGYNDGK